jgi:ribosomal 50S subunit-associated protein YjgA (DUF615 family)
MPRDPRTNDDHLERRLERLEQRYRRARFVLAGAKAVYESLREMPGADQLQLRQALQRVEQAQQQLVDINSGIEFLEDQEHVA